MRNLWIGVAGFCGAVARHQLDTLVGRYQQGAFPWGTLVVNVTGCFLLGVLLTWTSGRFDANPAVRPALTIGFLGAYTTFSTFSLQAVRLGEDGRLGLAIGYVAASVAVGLAAAWAGMATGRAWT